MGEEIVFVRRASGLIREIGPWTVMVVGANYTIADGIYNLTEWQSYQTPGANYPLALVLGGLILSLAALCILFLAAATPRASSDYVAISRTLHPMVGYVEAFMNIGVNAWVAGALAYFQAWYFGSFFIQAGIATHNPDFIALGTWMSTETWFGVSLGVAVVLIFTVINLLGIKAFKYSVNILFAIALVASIVTVGAALYGVSIGTQGVAALWDKTYGPGAWQEIVDVAQRAGWSEYVAKFTGDPSAWGWPGNWVSQTTLAALVPAAYAFWGIDMQNYIGGEVSRPKRSFMLGILGAIAITFVYYLLIAVPTLAMYGPFTSFYNYVMYGGHGQELLMINTIQTPTIAVMLASILGGIMPWAAVIVTLGVALWVLNGIPVYTIIPSRILFAMSFDRFMPQQFAEVNARFRTPHWSVLVTMILSIIFVFLTAYTPWFYVISVITAMFVRWLFASWTAMILPYQRPDLYEQGYTKKIAKVPLITIVGALSTVTMSALFVIGMSQLAGDVVSLTWFVIWFAVGALLFAFYLARNSIRGVKIETLFREIPPA
jgi:amino acid transporter